MPRLALPGDRITPPSLEHVESTASSSSRRIPGFGSAWVAPRPEAARRRAAAGSGARRAGGHERDLFHAARPDPEVEAQFRSGGGSALRVSGFGRPFTLERLRPVIVRGVGRGYQGRSSRSLAEHWGESL